MICRVWLLAAVVAASGCAHAKGPYVEQRRKVLDSKRIVLGREPGPGIVKTAEWGPGDVLSAQIGRQILCRQGAEERVANSTLTTYQTDGIGLGIGAGSAFVLGGAIGIAVAPTVSNVAPEGDKASPRETAYGLSAVSLIVGAILLGDALYVAVQASDHETEPRIRTERGWPAATPSACGESGPGRGQLVADVDGRRTTLTAPESRSFELPLRRHADALCARARDVDSDAHIYFVPEDPPGDEFEVSSHALHDCVVATTVREALTKTERALGDATTATTLARIAKDLQEATAKLQTLPRSDPDFATLQERATTTSGAMSRRAAEVLDKEARRAVREVQVSLAEAKQTVAEVASLAVSADDGRDAWVMVYGEFARQGAKQGLDGYAQLVALIARDPAAQRVVEGASVSWLTPELAAGAMQPVLQDVSQHVQRATDTYERAGTGVERGVNAKSVRALDDALEQRAEVDKICADLKIPLPPLKDACGSFLEGTEAVDEALAPHQTKIGSMRAEIRERDRMKRARRVAQTWRKHFAQCRKLREGIAQVESVQAAGRCGADCMTVVTRMRAEYARLNEFSVDDDVEDADLLDALQGECASAGCSVCP